MKDLNKYLGDTTSRDEGRVTPVCGWTCHRVLSNSIPHTRGPTEDGNFTRDYDGIGGLVDFDLYNYQSRVLFNVKSQRMDSHVRDSDRNENFN